LISPGDEESKITFSGYNPEYSTEEIKWHNLVSDTYWTTNLTGAQIGNKTLNISAHQVVIDTGTSFNLLPDEDFYEIVKPFNETYACGSLGPLMQNLFLCECTYE